MSKKFQKLSVAGSPHCSIDDMGVDSEMDAIAGFSQIFYALRFPNLREKPRRPIISNVMPQNLDSLGIELVSNYLYEVPLPPVAGVEAIYCLADPDSGAIRYIGRSNYPPRRFADHISVAKKLRSRGRLVPPDAPGFSLPDWIALLLERGTHPRMFVLALVSQGEAVREERNWIERHRKSGTALLNDGDLLRRYSIVDMQLLGKLAGGVCLSQEYKGIAAPLEWQCNTCRRNFQKTPYRVLQGSWCNPCSSQERNLLGICSTDLMLRRSKLIRAAF